MGFKDLLVGVGLVGLFAVAMVMFAYQLQVDNNVNVTVLDDPNARFINKTIRANVESNRQNANDQIENFQGQDPQGGDEGFGLLAIVGVVFTFITATVTGVFDLTRFISSSLGVPAIALNMLIAGVSITVLILGWRVIKAGGP